MKALLKLAIGGLSMAIAVPAFPQHTPPPTDLKVEYSPYPSQTFPNRVYFGDTHLHTGYSTDAGMVGCILTPEDALRVSRGEAVSAEGEVIDAWTQQLNR